MKRFVIAISVLMLTLSACGSSAFAQDSRRFTVEELLKVRRVGDPQVSPDGKRVAFTIGDVNWDANKVVTQIYVSSDRPSGIVKRTDGLGTRSGDKRFHLPGVGYIPSLAGKDTRSLVE